MTEWKLDNSWKKADAIRAEFARRVMDDSRSELDQMLGRLLNSAARAAVRGIIVRHALAMADRGQLADLGVHGSGDIAKLGVELSDAMGRMGRLDVGFNFTGTVLEDPS